MAYKNRRSSLQPFNTTEMLLRHNQWQILVLIFMQYCVNKHKHTAATWIQSHTHTHSLHLKAMSNSRDKIHKAKLKIIISHLHLWSFTPQFALDVRLSPPPLFYTHTEPDKVALQEPLWMWKAKAKLEITSALMVKVKGGRLITSPHLVQGLYIKRSDYN